MASVVFAMIFDMLDGRAARMLGADTRFGAQLDSLADLVSFGMAPGIIMYSWSLSRMGAAGWIATLIFCAASAIRLARFNVQSVRDEGATKADPYFTGLPTPAAACMMLLPLLISFQWDGDRCVREPWVVLTMMAITSVMMVSRLPTPSIKYMRLSREHRLLAGFCGGILAALLIAWPWATLTGGAADLYRDHSGGDGGAPSRRAPAARRLASLTTRNNSYQIFQSRKFRDASARWA